MSYNVFDEDGNFEDEWENDYGDECVEFGHCFCNGQYCCYCGLECQ